MSTKTTSRERTWTPRYAWMPVSTRHIKNGAHRSARRSPTTLPERLGEQRHVELDGRDVVVRALDPADRRREDVRLRPRFFRDALGQLEVIPGLHEDHLNAFGLRSEERREGKSVDLGGRRIIKKKKKLKAASTDHT